MTPRPSLLKTDLRVMKWMLGLTIAVNLATLFVLIWLAIGGAGG